jgi:hypothetical protein
VALEACSGRVYSAGGGGSVLHDGGDLWEITGDQSRGHVSQPRTILQGARIRAGIRHGSVPTTGAHAARGRKRGKGPF